MGDRSKRELEYQRSIARMREAEKNRPPPFLYKCHCGRDQYSGMTIWGVTDKRGNVTYYCDEHLPADA